MCDASSQGIRVTFIKITLYGFNILKSKVMHKDLTLIPILLQVVRCLSHAKHKKKTAVNFKSTKGNE
jgi:hypothetical protein